MADFTFTPSSFGGGWLVPHGADAKAFGQFIFDDPAPLAPLGGDTGWIVEPHDMVALSHFADGGYSIERAA